MSRDRAALAAALRAAGASEDGLARVEAGEGPDEARDAAALRWLGELEEEAQARVRWEARFGAGPVADASPRARARWKAAHYLAMSGRARLALSVLEEATAAPPLDPAARRGAILTAGSLTGGGGIPALTEAEREAVAANPDGIHALGVVEAAVARVRAHAAKAREALEARARGTRRDT